jgi:Domain of unknown function (DUF1707)/Cell wall-active antibiotics response 4TMS YvqF
VLGPTQRPFSVINWAHHIVKSMPGKDQRSQWLASDDDRDEALRALRQALVDGRITTEQHGERVSKVLVARYVSELDDLTGDIPPTERLPANVDHGSAPARMQRTHGVLRSVSLRPRGDVPDQLRSGALGGNAEIDLRDAVIPSDGLEVKVWAYFGDVTVVVPPRVQVSLLATPVLGRVEQAIASSPAGGPKIRIRALALFGDISVRTESPSSPSANASEVG